MTASRYFPPDSPWPYNAVAEERVHPHVDWLTIQLVPLAGEPARHRLALEHAQFIWSCVSLIRADLKHEVRRRRVDRDHVRGTRKELEGLRHAARAFVRTGDRQQWCEVWIATSPETRALVWPDHPRKMVDAEKVMEVDTTDGLHTIAPRPDDDAVLLRIGVALQKHGAGRREIDTRLLELTDAIRAAFRALTDLQTLDQNARHKLECLARVIDQHFTLGIYLTHSSRFLERLLRND